jgi:hypothetical protein
MYSGKSRHPFAAWADQYRVFHRKLSSPAGARAATRQPVGATESDNTDAVLSPDRS